MTCTGECSFDKTDVPLIRLTKMTEEIAQEYKRESVERIKEQMKRVDEEQKMLAINKKAHNNSIGTQHL